MNSKPAVSPVHRRISMKTIPLVLLSFFISAQINTAYSNEYSVEVELTYRITVIDGSSFIGEVSFETENSINFLTMSGQEVIIERKSIREIELLYGEIRNGKYVQYDPNAYRLLFIPTARPLQHGAGSVALYEMFFPLVSFGLGNVLTIGGGMPFLEFSQSRRQVIYFSSKITPISAENFDLAFGAMYTSLWDNKDDAAGIFYSIGTFGSSAEAITVGLAWSHQNGVNDDHFEINRMTQYNMPKPFAIVGGELLLNNSLKLMTENWIPLKGDVYLTSLGLRFIGSRISVDMGIFAPIPLISDKSQGWVPWVNLVYNFGYR